MLRCLLSLQQQQRLLCERTSGVWSLLGSVTCCDDGLVIESENGSGVGSGNQQNSEGNIYALVKPHVKKAT